MAKIPIYYIKTIEGYYSGEGDGDYKTSSADDVARFDGREQDLFRGQRGGIEKW